jgi:hypothetical protein
MKSLAAKPMISDSSAPQAGASSPFCLAKQSCDVQTPRDAARVDQPLHLTAIQDVAGSTDHFS